MGRTPPQELVALVTELGLATRQEVAALHRRVARLARGVPDFQSVWVDALAQARLLSPMQAAWINAGRGRDLRAGRFLLESRLPSPGWATWYRARSSDGAGPYRLALLEQTGGPTADAESRLKRLIRDSTGLVERADDGLLPVLEAGAEGGRVWAVSRDERATTAADWLVQHGRFPPGVVLEMARQMAASLARVHAERMVHADPSVIGLLVTDGGRVVLAQPGLRMAARPVESYADAHRPPIDYDYLAPERPQRPAPASVASDLYACGCVWWHLLTGRPPLAGATALAKMRSAQATSIPAVRRLAPDTPPELAEMISACTARQPEARPDSAEAVAAALGASTPQGRRDLARCIRRGRPIALRTPTALRNLPARRVATKWGAAAAVGAAGLLLAWGAVALRPTNGPVPRELAGADSPVETGPEGDSQVDTSRSDSAGGGRGLEAQSGFPSKPSEPGDAPSPSAAEQPPRKSDDQVVPAGFDAAEPAGAPPGDDPQEPVLVLSSQGPVRGEALPLRPKLRVCGPAGGRATVELPEAGLPVEVPGVCFERVDFVWSRDPTGNRVPTAPATMIRLASADVEFRQCTFAAPASQEDPPVAIGWSYPPDRRTTELRLPSGRVTVSRCVFRGIRSAIDSRAAGTLGLELSDVLVLGGGSMLQFDHAPAADEAVVLRLSRVTLRDGGPLLTLAVGEGPGATGRVSIQATDCVFAPSDGCALLRFSADQAPGHLLRRITWEGQGSLVRPDVPVAAWRQADGSTQPLSDAELAIEGLVRSRVEFAGAAASGVEASRVLRWQAPLQSAEAPGVDPARLSR